MPHGLPEQNIHNCFKNRKSSNKENQIFMSTWKKNAWILKPEDLRTMPYALKANFWQVLYPLWVTVSSVSTYHSIIFYFLFSLFILFIFTFIFIFFDSFCPLLPSLFSFFLPYFLLSFLVCSTICTRDIGISTPTMAFLNPPYSFMHFLSR